MHIDISGRGVLMPKPGARIVAATIVDRNGTVQLSPERRKELRRFLEKMGKVLTPPDHVDVGQKFVDVRYQSRKDPSLKKHLTVLDFYPSEDARVARCLVCIVEPLAWQGFREVSRRYLAIPVSHLEDPDRYRMIEWP